MSSVDLPNGKQYIFYRLEQAEKRIDGLEDKIDDLSDRINRLIMASVVAVFTFAGAILLLALNLVVSRGG